LREHKFTYLLTHILFFVSAAILSKINDGDDDNDDDDEDNNDDDDNNGMRTIIPTGFRA